MPRTIEIKEFAERVERLCDFLLSKLSDDNARDGSPDVKVIEDLKDDAADIHTGAASVLSESFFGLSDYMKGGTQVEPRS